MRSRALVSITVMLVTILLVGCTLGPDYKRPETVMPDAFEEAGDTGASIANLNWWELFGDEQLNELIRLALEQNKDMAIAISRIEEARAALGFVRSDQYPQFGISGGASRGNSIPGTSVITPVSNNFVLAGNLSYELDLWGKLRRSTESAQAELLATVEASNSVMITLIADVSSAYLLLLDLDARVAIADRTLETRIDSLEIIQARFDRGTVALIDVNQAEIEKFDAEAELYALQRENVQVENLLNVLLGQNPGGILRNRKDICGPAIRAIRASPGHSCRRTTACSTDSENRCRRSHSFSFNRPDGIPWTGQPGIIGFFLRRQ